MKTWLSILIFIFVAWSTMIYYVQQYYSTLVTRLYIVVGALIMTITLVKTINKFEKL